MSSERRASRGSVSGSSGDGGVEYRRGVAAYAVALGLAGAPLDGFGVLPAHAQVRAVVLETDDDVDDVRIDFDSGWTAFVQAKRSLQSGKVLDKAIAQWVEAGKGSLDPSKHRLVIVAGNLSGTMKALQLVLDRERLAVSGARTKKESAILKHVEDRLKELSVTQRSLVLKCAVICELAVEEPGHHGAQHAISYLQNLIASRSGSDARRAWKSLVDIAGQSARLRAGSDLAEWFVLLCGEGTTFGVLGSTPAADLEKRHEAMARYRARLEREGTWINFRVLGAQLPAILAEEADAEVLVSTGVDDRSGTELLWAFMRRGRVVLTGLPGGGKSTAIRKLAAQLCTLPSAPLPIRVSLRDVDVFDRELSFRDRLLAVAVRDDRADDRLLIRAEIERRLDSGGIALLLDSLDETYDHRAAVVGEIEAFLSNICPDVDVLLATRDVAYGHAATLGWSSVRMRAPAKIENVTSAVLQAASKLANSPDKEQWVAERTEWIGRVLNQERALRETPLIPALLSILSIERAFARLPTRRASVLAAVVQDVVARHELVREDGRTLGTLSGSNLHTAAMDAFTSEAEAILSCNGTASYEAVVEAVSNELRKEWGLSSGYAKATAIDAVRFFDESGIFVMSGAEGTVAPRVALFAEIGDALRIAARSGEIKQWVATRIGARQFEPIVLAAAFSVEVAELLCGIAGNSPTDRALLQAAVQAVTEGAKPGEEIIRSLSEALIREIAVDTNEAWKLWQELISLPFPEDLHEAAKLAAGVHGPVQAQVATIALDVRFGRLDEHIQSPESVLEVMRLSDLPRPRPEGTLASLKYQLVTIDSVLTDTQLAAAVTFLPHIPALAPLIADRAAHGPTLLNEPFRNLLQKHGFDAEVARLDKIDGERLASFKMPKWASDLRDVEGRILGLLVDARHARLDYRQAARLDDLADFLETLDMNDASVIRMHRLSDEYYERVVRLAISLYGFDEEILAAQAQIVIDRLAGEGLRSPYYSLFDLARQRTEADWNAVRDLDAAVELLVHLFKLGRSQARFAAVSLWAAPVADMAAPLLRRLIVARSITPENERYAALALCSLVDGPEPGAWIRNEDPVLRAVAAEAVELPHAQALGAEFQRLLADSDGHVRVAALKRAAIVSPPDLETILSEAAVGEKPGWMCLSCCTVNPPGAGAGCAGNDCYIAGPDPAKVAGELLAAREGGN